MIEASEICKLLRYEPETGKLFWKPRVIELFKDAVQARKIAEILAGYHPNHGRSVATQGV